MAYYIFGLIFRMISTFLSWDNFKMTTIQVHEFRNWSWKINRCRLYQLYYSSWSRWSKCLYIMNEVTQVYISLILWLEPAYGSLKNENGIWGREEELNSASVPYSASTIYLIIQASMPKQIVSCMVHVGCMARFGCMARMAWHCMAPFYQSLTNQTLTHQSFTSMTRHTWNKPYWPPNHNNSHIWAHKHDRQTNLVSITMYSWTRTPFLAQL